jgi:serine/threonine protein kinase
MPEPSERWRQIERVFTALATLPPGERAAYLDQTCPEDPELRQEVESLLAYDEPAGATELTLQSHPLTPDFSSPKQVRGGPVTTATDVYALGAVLYHLLTGTKPHRLGTYSALEVEQAVCEREPPRPSTIAPEKFRRHLAGDLDAGGAIVASWEARQAHKQSQVAQERLRDIVDLAGVAFFDIHNALERLPGATSARKQMVEATLNYLDKVAKTSGDDPGI